jgi:hypothetical protein
MWAVVAPFVLALLGAASARADAASCAPWPGEPTPLPTTTSGDAFLARFAVLRKQELTEAAKAAERTAPARAQRLWQHALCLDPTSREVVRGVERTRPVHVYHPTVVVVRRPPAEPNTPRLEDLGSTIRVVMTPASRRPSTPPVSASARTAPKAPSPAPDWKPADDALGAAEAQLRGADFEAALATATRVRQQLGPSASAKGAREREARAEVVAGTAEVALGREEAARKSFERALAADPKLQLDPTTTSPKVRRAFDAARASQGTKP